MFAISGVCGSRTAKEKFSFAWVTNGPPASEAVKLQQRFALPLRNAIIKF
jgi:hypothetical protein